ncbi:MAG TPA: hypothetical protein V6D23_10580, partial [Candidatus Obscuribacterales bacterium]
TCGACPIWFIEVFALDRRGRLISVASEEFADDIEYRDQIQLVVDPGAGFHFRYHASVPPEKEGDPWVEKDVEKPFRWSDYLALARTRLTPP